MERAIFAGGCFWCMIQPFDELEGVHSIFPAIPQDIPKIRLMKRSKAIKPGIQKQWKSFLILKKSVMKTF